MLVNFCHPALHEYTTVSSPSIATDDYEVGNFQSPSAAQRSRGFMAERFIKPPVDIFIRFRHPVSVACIVAETGNEKAGLEVWTPCAYSDGMHAVGVYGTTPVTATYERRLSQARVAATRSTAVKFMPISWQTSTIAAVGSFAPPAKLQLGEECPLQQERRFAHLSTLAVRIYFVSGAVAPKLKVLEVWARPSSSGGWSKPDIAKYDAIIRSLSTTNAGSAVHRVSSSTASDSSKRSDSESSEQSRVPCAPRDSSSGRSVTSACSAAPKPHPAAGNVLQTGPAEFYDSITDEMMYTPVLLPSGNNVDASTLEKVAENDRRWGRQPSDPFTGKPLTHSYKAEVNSGLKARIDSFLSRRDRYKTTAASRSQATSRSCSTSPLSRALGVVENSGAHSPSSLSQAGGVVANAGANSTSSLSLAGEVVSGQKINRKISRKSNEPKEASQLCHGTVSTTLAPPLVSRGKHRSDSQLDLAADCRRGPDIKGCRSVGSSVSSDSRNEIAPGVPKRTRLFSNSAGLEGLSDHDRSMNASLNDALDKILGP